MHPKITSRPHYGRHLVIMQVLGPCATVLRSYSDGKMNVHFFQITLTEKRFDRHAEMVSLNVFALLLETFAQKPYRTHVSENRLARKTF